MGAGYPSPVIAVDDKAKSLKLFIESEGRLLGEPTDIQGVRKYVSLEDTKVNRLGILEPIRS